MLVVSVPSTGHPWVLLISVPSTGCPWVLVFSVPSSGHPCPLAASNAVSHPSCAALLRSFPWEEHLCPQPVSPSSQTLDLQDPGVVLEKHRADASPTFSARASGSHSRGHAGARMLFPSSWSPAACLLEC